MGRAIWRIGWPVMLMNALWTALTIVDMFWVGRLGHVAVAAVAMGGTMLGVLFSLGQTFATATLALAARATGAGDREMLLGSLRHTLIPALACGAVLAAIGIPLAAPLLRLLRAAPEVVSTGTPYLVVLFAQLPGYYAGMVVYSLFQAMGDTRTPMYVIVGANLLNIALDPLLIMGWGFVPGFGVLGAALATAASHLLGFAVMAVILGRRGLLKLGGKLERQKLATVFRVGIPAGLHGVTRPLTGTLMFGIVNGFGSVATAAFGIGMRILQVMWIYLGGLGAAGEALVGQSLGRKDPDTARRIANRVTVIALLLQAAVMPVLFVLAPHVIRVFNANPEVVRYGTSYLRLLTPVLLVLGASMGWAAAQRGAGDTRPPMIAALVSNWAVKLPLAWLLATWTGFGLTGVWIGIGASIVVETGMLGIWYRRGGWQRKELRWA